MTPHSPITLVALSGLAGSGKDVAAAQMASGGWRRQAFADKVRQVAYALDPIIPVLTGYVRLAPLVDEYGWDRVKRSYPEVRRLLQRIGTEGGRQVLGQDVWVDAALRKVTGPTIFTDCRFPNEADAVRARGGVAIRIERPGLESLRDEHGQVHLSETALDGYAFDAVIRNQGSVEDLGRLLAEAVAWLSATGR